MRDTRRLRVARRGARKPDYGRCEVSDDIDLTDDEYDTFIVDLAEHADTACPPPPERAILLDPIADLRDWDSYYCKAAAADFADRAEARLREVQGE